jgi:hypothetical protein
MANNIPGHFYNSNSLFLLLILLFGMVWQNHDEQSLYL